MICDRVYGTITLSPLLKRIASTPEFHRLDGVRQLGGCARVFPSATHTRREHSLGVSHLAGRLAQVLRAQRPDLVDDDDVLCVQLAGLVHDLGHGPFSHLFESFLPGWSHEEMGLRILHEVILARIDVATFFSSNSLSVDVHLRFVDLLVRGIDVDAPWPSDEVGRPPEKRFLTDIVHNRRTGLDVDKMDYLARDALAVFGATRPLEVARLVHGAKLVVEPDGTTTIGYDESVALDVIELYALRARLHRQVYQHRDVVAVESRLRVMMQQLDATLDLTGMADAPHRFVHLTDEWVLNQARVHTPEEWGALFALPLRVPCTAWLRTLPSCAACGGATDISDAFCTRCGASTEVRAHAPVVVDTSTMCMPPECAITSHEATQQVRDRCTSTTTSRVVVHIVDVHAGVAMPMADPHGRLWRVFDPLRAVRFCDAQGRRVHVDAPCVRHERTAMCYLPHDADDEEVRRATRAFVAWAKTVGGI